MLTRMHIVCLGLSQLHSNKGSEYTQFQIKGDSNPFLCLSDPYLCLSDPYLCLSDPYMCLSDQYLCLSDPYLCQNNPEMGQPDVQSLTNLAKNMSCGFPYFDLSAFISNEHSFLSLFSAFWCPLFEKTDVFKIT